MITMTHDEHLWHLENVKRIAELEAERDALRAERDEMARIAGKALMEIMAIAEKEGE